VVLFFVNSRFTILLSYVYLHDKKEKMGIGGSEILLIIIVFVLLFGADKLPEFARGLGKGIREFKKAADDIKSEISNSTSDIKKELDDAKDNINKTLKS
jgi:sec-independent protein translocase protein TatA